MKSLRDTISHGLWLILTVCTVSSPLAAERLGSCADEAHRLQVSGRDVDDLRGLRPVRHRAPIFRSASNKKVTGFLSFDEVVFGSQVKKRKIDWVQISRAGFERPLGWLPASELLCVDRPLIDEQTSRPRVFFIGAQNLWSEVYPSPDENQCLNRCKKLEAPNVFFIVAEDQRSGRLLLSEHSELRTDQPLLGWIDRRAGVEWKEPFGLRPRMDTGEVYGYANWADAAQAAEDVPVSRVARIEAGEDWLALPIRLPVLQIDPGAPETIYRFYAPNEWSFDVPDSLEDASPWSDVWAALADSWVLESWLTHAELSRWINVLHMPYLQEAEAEERNMQLAEQLAENLLQESGPPGIQSWKPIGKFLERQGLPGYEDSPFLHLSLQNIRDLPDCAVELLRGWLDTSQSILKEILSSPGVAIESQMLVPTEEEMICADQTGFRIPRRSYSILTRDSTGQGSEVNGRYGYESSYLGASRYWIPRDLLP